MQRSGMINKNEIESKVRTGKELETLRTSYTFPSSFGHALQLYESQKPGIRKKIKFEFDGDLPDIPSRNRREKDDFNANLTLAQFNSDRIKRRKIKQNISEFNQPCCCQLKRRKSKQQGTRASPLKRRGKFARKGDRYA